MPACPLLRKQNQAITRLPDFAVQSAKAVEAELLEMQKAAQAAIKGHPEGFNFKQTDANELVTTPWFCFFKFK